MKTLTNLIAGLLFSLPSTAQSDTITYEIKGNCPCDSSKTTYSCYQKINLNYKIRLDNFKIPYQYHEAITKVNVIMNLDSLGQFKHYEIRQNIDPNLKKLILENVKSYPIIIYQSYCPNFENYPKSIRLDVKHN